LLLKTFLDGRSTCAVRYCHVRPCVCVMMSHMLWLFNGFEPHAYALSEHDRNSVSSTPESTALPYGSTYMQVMPVRVSYGHDLHISATVSSAFTQQATNQT
jgi:hypothetical protein